MDFKSAINQSRSLIESKDYLSALDLIAQAQQQARDESENATVLLYKGFALMALAQKYDQEARGAFREAQERGAVELPMKADPPVLRAFSEEGKNSHQRSGSPPSRRPEPDERVLSPDAQGSLGTELSHVEEFYENEKYQEALIQLAQARQVAHHDEQIRTVRLYEGMILFSLGQQQRREAVGAVHHALVASPKAQSAVVIPAKTNKDKDLMGAFLKVQKEVQEDLKRQAALPKDKQARWRTAASMAKAREHHTATLLPSGKVLVAGGVNSEGALADAELYDPTTDHWTPTDRMSTSRYRHTAILLPSGKVLVMAGENDDEGVLSSAELYDPATGTWSPTGGMNVGRHHHSATLLSSGKVLIAGGEDSSGESATSAEVYDPTTGTWTATGDMASNRVSHAAMLLPSGKVLVMGGNDAGNALSSSELYDPAMGTWSSSGDMPTGAYDHQASLVPSGKVMVTGGYDGEAALSRVVLFDPAEGTWGPSAVDTGTGRTAHTATVLLSGKVLVAGGESTSSPIAGVSEVYEPAKGAWLLTASMSQGRVGHTATLLSSGRVLLVGGSNEDIPLTSAELYIP
jgi:N-acetylneuraminic acid mutarotase